MNLKQLMRNSEILSRKVKKLLPKNPTLFISITALGPTLQSSLDTPLDHHPRVQTSLCDVHLFASLKETLGGKWFEDDAGVEGFLRNRLVTKPRSFYDESIEKLSIRWAKCISSIGDYVKSNMYFPSFVTSNKKFI